MPSPTDLTSLPTDPGTAVESSVATADGLNLRGRHHRLAAPRGRVLLIHGYAEHLGRYDEVVELLLRQGLECDQLDLRGHGRSGGARGHISRFGTYRDDLDRFLATSPWSEPTRGLESLPRLVLGHSLGGLLALSYALHRPGTFGALAVTSPFLAPSLEVPAFKVALGQLAAYVAPELNLPGEIDPVFLTHDLEKVRQYREDPLVFHTVNPRWFLECREAQQELEKRAPEIVLPALFLLAGDDRVADSDQGRKVFERLGSDDKELHIYPGFYHEVLNETDRGQVFDALLPWLARRAARSAVNREGI